jgi:hypothetical protein
MSDPIVADSFLDDIVGFVKTLSDTDNTPAWYYILTRVGTDDPVYIEFTTKGEVPAKDAPAPFPPTRLLELARKFHEQFIQGSRAIYQENSLEERFHQYLASKTQAIHEEEKKKGAAYEVVAATVPESKAAEPAAAAASAPAESKASEHDNAVQDEVAKAKAALKKSLEVLQRSIAVHDPSSSTESASFKARKPTKAPKRPDHEVRLEKLKTKLTKDIAEALASKTTPKGQLLTIKAALRNVHLQQRFGL